MHKYISIENFKCFSEATKIDLSKINVCLGCNSVGKSSAMQSLILIRQICEEARRFQGTHVDRFRIQLNDIYGLQLGDSEHIKSARNKEEIVFQIDGYEFKLNSIKDSPMEMETGNLADYEILSHEQGIFSDQFFYLNAERIGPRNYQLIDSKLLNTCGVHGENTVHLLNRLAIKNVAEDKCFNLEEKKKVSTLNKQVEYWMDYIIPGIEIITDDITDLRVSKMSLQQASLDTGFLSPYNFGFGISYVLPIIVTGLIAKKESLFLVENPEAHLHPRGQSHIGYFLGKMAMAGVQIIIETHSEHVLNGIRIAALRNGMKPEDISINFFSVAGSEKESKPRVQHIELNDRMDIQNWPEGFMDQEEEDLRTLRKLRSN